MNCPRCGTVLLAYSGTFTTSGVQYRYRRCSNCGERVQTAEQIVRHIERGNDSKGKSVNR